MTLLESGISSSGAPRAVVFDVGEVLIDETRVWEVWARMLGVSPLTFAAVLGAAIVQGQDHLEVFPHLAPNIDWTELEDEHERIYGGFQEQDLYPDARRVIDELSATHRVMIIGNQPARRSSQLSELLSCELILTSEELGAQKPSQVFFEEVVRRCSPIPPSRILYVGDRVDNDIEPAILAGLRTCWLQRGPWGQLQELPDDLEPDLVLEGLGELPSLLLDWASNEEEESP